MSWHVSIRHPDPTRPIPNEPVASFCMCPGNILMATEDVGFARLNQIPHDTRAEAMRALLTELRIGNAGHFNDQWWEQADQKWSGGRESMERFRWRDIYDTPETATLHDFEAWWGALRRHEMIGDAERFLGYFEAGYIVDFEW